MLDGAGLLHKYVDLRELPHYLADQDAAPMWCDITSTQGGQFGLSGRLIKGYAVQGLTAIPTIFLPLTFITGLCGMNFDHMGELHTSYGYFVILSVLATVGLSMLYYLRRNDMFLWALFTAPGHPKPLQPTGHQLYHYHA